MNFLSGLLVVRVIEGSPRANRCVPAPGARSGTATSAKNDIALEDMRGIVVVERRHIYIRIRSRRHLSTKSTMDSVRVACAQILVSVVCPTVGSTF